MKKKNLYLLYIPLFILGIVYLYIMNKRDIDKRNSAPKIRFEDTLNINVQKISFERNDLFINGKIYNASGISSYSRVKNYHSGDSLSLDEINPPFDLRKGKNNDTLFVIQRANTYYLSIDKEVKFAHGN